MAVGTPMGSSSFVNATAADANGNVYIAGSFSGTAIFGAVTLLSTNSYDNMFVAKWHPATGFAWAQQVGGSGSSHSTGLVFSNSSVYVAVFFADTVSFGSTKLTN